MSYLYAVKRTESNNEAIYVSHFNTFLSSSLHMKWGHFTQNHVQVNLKYISWWKTYICMVNPFLFSSKIPWIINYSRSGLCFKNMHKLLYMRVHKIVTLHINHFSNEYNFCGISKGFWNISQKSYTYTEICVFHLQVIIPELLGLRVLVLRAHEHSQDCPLILPSQRGQNQ